MYRCHMIKESKQSFFTFIDLQLDITEQKAAAGERETSIQDLSSSTVGVGLFFKDVPGLSS